MRETLLFWIFVAIFSVTAVITLLGITGAIKTIKEKYLNALFTALILEVVAAVVLLFREVDLNEDSTFCYEEILAQAGIESEDQNAKQVILAALQTNKNAPQLAALQEELENTRDSLSEVQQILDDRDEDFYGKIRRLRELIEDNRDDWINIAYRESEKEEVYRILIFIFESLGEVSDETPIYSDPEKRVINKRTVQTLYANYKKKRQIWRPDENENQIYIFKSDTVVMLKDYLDKQLQR